VRTQQAADRLRDPGSPDLVPVLIDVTDTASIASALHRVRDEGIPLAGLVNNAGTQVLAPVESLDLADVRKVVEVNLIGQIAVVQAALPLLRRSRGRVVNVSSVAGRLAAPMFGAYAASKFGLEAVSDSLRREVRGDGIEVVLVEPGAVATPIWTKSAPSAVPPRYAALAAGVQHGLVERSARRGIAPEAVAEVVVTALTARRPRTRYLVGSDAKARVRLAGLLPDRLVDTLMVAAFVRAGRAG
jgi:NAD(P)-dependent dehydrogenase (short-subunit alcohol dehydrogenase family)